MYRLALPFLLCLGVSCPALAQQPTDASPNSSPLQLKIGEGELRLDGQIAAVLDTGVWQLNALSWTSVSGRTTTFPSQKAKTLKMGANFFAHLDGQRASLSPDHVTLGTRVAVVGRNKNDGSLDVREVVLFGPANKEYTLGGEHAITAEAARLGELGRRARNVGDYNEAIRLDKRALEAARGENDGWGERWALAELGAAHIGALQLDAALGDYQQLQVLAHTAGDAQKEAMAFHQQGVLLSKQNKREEALRCSLAALALHPADTQLELAVRMAIGNEYLDLVRNDEAEAMIETVIPLANSLHDATQSADESVLLASLRTLKNNPALEMSVQSLIAQVREQLPQANPPGRRAEIEQKLAQLLWYRGDHEGARQEIEAAVTDFTTDRRLAEADQARVKLQRWQEGGSPFDTSAK